MARKLVSSVALMGLALGAGGVQPAIAKKPPPVITRSQTVAGSGNATILSANPTCPKKTRAVGGGFLRTPASTDVLPVIFESRKVGQRGWRVSLQIADGDMPDPVSLTASIYCRKGAPATKTASLTTLTPASPALTTPAAAICERGRKALGGGFVTSLAPLGISQGAIVIESAPGAGSSWTVRAIGGAVSSTLTTEAYCAKTKAPREFSAISPPSPVMRAAATTATVQCGKGTALMGGFSQPSAAYGPDFISVLLPYESQRNGPTWRVSGTSGSIYPATITASVLCG